MKWLDSISKKIFRKKKTPTLPKNDDVQRRERPVEEMRFEFLSPCLLEANDLVYVASEKDEELEKELESNLKLFKGWGLLAGLHIVYLPSLMKKLQDKKVLRYRAPYLKDDEVKDITIGNDFMLQYLKNPEDRDKMKHGLIRKERFSPGRGEKDSYSVRFYPLSSEGSESLDKQLNRIIDVIKHEILSGPVFSRYNSIVFEREIEENQMRTFECRTNRQKEPEDMLGSEGEKEQLGATHFEIPYDRPELEKKRGFCPSMPSKPRVDNDYADRRFNSQMEGENTDDLMEEIRELIKKLRQRGIAESLLLQLLHPDDKPRKMVITKDYQILLPEFNNMEIKMEPLVKAVYLLFLNHPEGIVFKNLPDYRTELTQIYLRLRPNGLTERARQSIEDVTNPLSNSINEKCARIRGAFLREFDNHIARYYYIDGMRATPKIIAIPRDLVVWEK